MKQGRRAVRGIAGLGLFSLLLVLSFASHAADSLNWRKDKDSVDADISSWSLVQTLEKIGEATGWEVYLEPGTTRNVSTKFKERPRDKALDFLLGDLGRVLLPQSNGLPARLLVFRSTQKSATQRVSKPRDDPTRHPIPNEIIVTLKPGENIDEIAKKLGAKVIGRNDALRTYRLQFEDADAATAARSELAQHPGVEAIDNNYYARRPETSEGFGLANPAAINLEPKAPTCPDGPTIGLIDTAVQMTGTPYDDLLLPAVHVAGEPALSPDVPAHGTGMAQAIFQALAKTQTKTEWRVRPYDVYGKNESSTTFDLANAVSRAISDGANPINLSLGSGGNSEFLHRIIQSGHRQGVVFIGAAGNEPTTAPTYPGAYPEVIAVTAIGADGHLAPYANRGDFVDVLAPGQVRLTFNGQTWVTAGTSVSTALVTGLAAGGVNGGCVNGERLRAALQGMIVPARK